MQFDICKSCGLVRGHEDTPCQKCKGVDFEILEEEQLTGEQWYDYARSLTDATETFNALRMSFKLGHIPAIALLGACYLNGDGCEPNPNKAYNYSLDAAASGNALATINLAKCYLEGIGCDRDYDRGISCLEFAASNGATGACALLANVYSHDYPGHPHDYEKALGWAKTGADNGQGHCMCILGRAYEYGIASIKKNPKKAVEFYKAGSEAGSPAAMERYGACLLTGFGCEVNEQEAIKWLTEAANHNDTTAMIRLAGVYFSGTEQTPAEPERAVKLLEHAHARGDMEAAYRLSIAYLIGNGVEADAERAMGLAVQAAQGGVAAAMNNVGKFYEDGIVVGQDNEAALEWYERAHAAGEVLGAVNAGAILLRTEGLTDEVFELLQEGVAACSPRAMYLLGKEMLEIEDEDHDYAQRLIQQACDVGFPPAMVYRARQLMALNPDDKSVVELLTHATELLDMDAAYELARLYEEGRLVGKDEQKAYSLFQAAASGDCTAAFYEVGRMRLFGIGCNADRIGAYVWLERARDTGDERASELLKEYAAG